MQEEDEIINDAFVLKLEEWLDKVTCPLRLTLN